MTKVDTAAHRPDRALQHIERAVHDGIIAPVLDDLAGMGNGRPVPPELPADFHKTQTVTDMGKLHGHLAGKGDIGLAPRDGAEGVIGDAERAGDGLLNNRVEKPARVTSPVAATKLRPECRKSACCHFHLQSITS